MDRLRRAGKEEEKQKEVERKAKESLNPKTIHDMIETETTGGLAGEETKEGMGT